MFWKFILWDAFGLLRASVGFHSHAERYGLSALCINVCMLTCMLVYICV